VVDGNFPTENQDNVVRPAVFQPVKDGVQRNAEKVCSFKPSPSLATTDTIIERGKTALIRLERDTQTWPDWRAVCEAQLAVQTLAMAAAQTNKPQGPRYRMAIKNYLVCYGFDRIHKSTRSLMCEIARNIDAIEAWRSTLSANELLELNHPRVVLTRWRRSLRSSSNQDDPEDTQEEGHKKEEEHNPLLVGWSKASPEQRTVGLAKVGFNNFRQAMPADWCKPMKDCVAGLRAEDWDPDVRITQGVQKAFAHIKIANDPKTSAPLAQGHEKEALDELRTALKALHAIKSRVQDLEVGISTTPKAKRRSS
jgi:hypothetical protein